ncbi:zinc-binding dehydrogenase [Wenjunlia tyrosinilytica]|uniref:zinc-binding dehydrogenase n=1 Tax=Wenjunlia tyrosinilytica TaxID=1544741 RepID=UPI00357179B6
MGADEVVDHTAQRFEEVLPKASFDTVLDRVGTEDYARRSLPLLEPGGTSVVVPLVVVPSAAPRPAAPAGTRMRASWSSRTGPTWNRSPLSRRTAGCGSAPDGLPAQGSIRGPSSVGIQRDPIQGRHDPRGPTTESLTTEPERRP